MKSDIEIKDDIYSALKGSALAKAVTGKICKTGVRPKGSTNEDIVISVKGNQMGQTQVAIVNVNIYVKDNIRDEQAEEKSDRCRELGRLAFAELEVIRGDSFRAYLESQSVIAVEDIDQHVISNKIIYKLNNED